MIKITIMRQRPTSDRPVAKCQFWLRMYKNNNKITWNTEKFTRRYGAVMAARSMRASLKDKCVIIDDMGREVR